MPTVVISWRPGSPSKMVMTKLVGQGEMFNSQCETTGGFPDCFWVTSECKPIYVTKSVYLSLSDGDRAYVRSHAAGCVTDAGFWTTYQYLSWTRYKFNPAVIIPFPSDDPCKDVSCPDKCVGVDKYDQVCQDGICVRGTLIETNSEHCGYTPEPEPDPTPTPSGDTAIIIVLMLAGTYMILRR